jgi:hypothetical protein
LLSLFCDRASQEDIGISPRRYLKLAAGSRLLDFDFERDLAVTLSACAR